MARSKICNFSMSYGFEELLNTISDWNPSNNKDGAKWSKASIIRMAVAFYAVFLIRKGCEDALGDGSSASVEEKENAIKLIAKLNDNNLFGWGKGFLADGLPVDRCVEAASIIFGERTEGKKVLDFIGLCPEGLDIC